MTSFSPSALRRPAATFTLAAALALAGCAKPASDGAQVLRVGSQKGGDRALLLASGALDGAPYKVEWSDFPAAQHLLEALSADAVDVGLVGDAPFLFAYAGGANIKAVQAVAAAPTKGGSSTAILVPAASPIHTLADLKGRRVATGRGSIGHYLLLRALDEAGLKPTDVTIVFLAPSDAKAAFATGAVDAWSTWAPYLPLAQKDGARVIADGHGLLSGYGFEVAAQHAIDAKGPLLADYLKRLARAERWGRAHQAEYAQALARETGLSPAIALQTIQLGDRGPALIDARVTAEERRVLATFQQAGAITARPDVEAGLDPRFNGSVAP